MDAASNLDVLLTPLPPSLTECCQTSSGSRNPADELSQAGEQIQPQPCIAAAAGGVVPGAGRADSRPGAGVAGRAEKSRQCHRPADSDQCQPGLRTGDGCPGVLIL